MQADTLTSIFACFLVIILKARQLGMTWLVLCFALWLAMFRPAATILIFSRREEESLYLLGDERIRGIYNHLPAWMRDMCPEGQPDQAKTWGLANGSILRAFPTTAGDSYTATLAIVDEADLCPDLNDLMRAVKPTIDGGGRMILLSRSDKSQPASEFKRIYVAAKQGLSPWKAIFLPWHARPERNTAWYEAQKADIFQRTGSLDDLHEQYPATDAEALAARTLDKRIAPAWLQQCYVEQRPLTFDVQAETKPPAIPGLVLYRVPWLGDKRGKDSFVIGADPAEGNPTSDDSSLTVLDADNGEEVASLSGKFQPAVFAAHIDIIGRFYNDAAVMVERNNHGHAVILWLNDNSRLIKYSGHDGKTGWLSNEKGKALLYDAAADAFREQETILHSFATLVQLGSIEGATLRAPEGELDDRADSYAFAVVGVQKKQRAKAEQGNGVPYVHR